MKITRFLKNNKKGLAQGAVFVVVVMLIIAGLAFFLGKSQKPSLLSITKEKSSSSGSSASSPTPRINLVDKTTVTFSSWDIRNKGTNAGTAHRLLMWKDGVGAQKGVNNVYADDGTVTMSPDDSYQVIIGNVTLSTNFIGGTYYPLYITGGVPDSGTHSVSGGQYLTANASQITFAFYDINDQVVTSGQAIGTNDDKTVKWKITPDADRCLGNPDTGGENIVTYHYNASVITSVEQYTVGSTSVDSSTSTPQGSQNPAGVNSAYSKISYNFPVVCGPASTEKKVRLKTGATENPATVNNVNMTVSDVSWGYNSKTFELIKGNVDNNNADLGMVDYVAGGLVTT